MKDTAPTMEEWKELYEAALAFKELAPWEWMWDSDIFGVENPETGETGYCCVMGGLGEHFALGVYPGTGGLISYMMLRDKGDEMEEPMEIIACQDCIMASFADREHLQPEDMNIIKKLGLKFRGRKAWPLFKRYLPCHAPWFISGTEARFLTVALRQTVEVAPRIKDDETLIVPKERGAFFVRFPEEKDGAIQWREEFRKPVEPEEPETEIIDITRLAGIHRDTLQRGGVWEIDYFLSPSGIREKGKRPYYPYMLLCTDQESSMIIGHHIAEPDGHQAEFFDYLVGLIEECEIVPEELWICRDEVVELVAPLVATFDIRLERADYLPSLDDAKSYLYSLLSNRIV